MEPTGPLVHVEPPRCPFCHEAILKGSPAIVCPGCHTLHHAACVAESPTCGACRKPIAPPAPVAPPAAKAHWAVHTAIGVVVGGGAAALLSPYAAPILLGAIFGGMVGAAAGRDP